mmetsp:Transcript_75459/g.245456  ORF Transcript_75459/g.245456 Transcript_75459/m.245456 type:complete len:204 (-) Transcript_75459:166-777(-)
MASCAWPRSNSHLEMACSSAASAFLNPSCRNSSKALRASRTASSARPSKAYASAAACSAQASPRLSPSSRKIAVASDEALAASSGLEAFKRKPAKASKAVAYIFLSPISLNNPIESLAHRCNCSVGSCPPAVSANASSVVASADLSPAFLAASSSLRPRSPAAPLTSPRARCASSSNRAARAAVGRSPAARQRSRARIAGPTA